MYEANVQKVRAYRRQAASAAEVEVLPADALAVMAYREQLLGRVGH